MTDDVKRSDHYVRAGYDMCCPKCGRVIHGEGDTLTDAVASYFDHIRSCASTRKGKR